MDIKKIVRLLGAEHRGKIRVRGGMIQTIEIDQDPRVPWSWVTRFPYGVGTIDYETFQRIPWMRSCRFIDAYLDMIIGKGIEMTPIELRREFAQVLSECLDLAKELGKGSA